MELMDLYPLINEKKFQYVWKEYSFSFYNNISSF